MMKKQNDTNSSVILILFLTCLSLLACNDDKKNFPSEYVGFQNSSNTVECDKNSNESDFEITIVAMEKSDKDRVVSLTTPPFQAGHPTVLRLTENKITIKAGKKSATTIIKIYPKQMIMKQQSVTITCIPQWKEGGVSKLTITLKQK